MATPKSHMHKLDLEIAREIYHQRHSCEDDQAAIIAMRMFGPVFFERTGISTPEQYLQQLKKELQEAHAIHMARVLNDLPSSSSTNVPDTPIMMVRIGYDVFQIFSKWTAEKTEVFLNAVSNCEQTETGIRFWVCSKQSGIHFLTLYQKDGSRVYIVIDTTDELTKLIRSFKGYADWSLETASNRFMHPAKANNTIGHTTCEFCRCDIRAIMVMSTDV